jgi:ribonucleoside-diphosphate reductase alpha chain
MAWLRGLKTTYYLRALSATSTEKSTLDRGTLNAVSSQTATTSSVAAEAATPEPTPPAVDPVSSADLELGDAAPVPLACSLDDPDCEACQ